MIKNTPYQREKPIAIVVFYYMRLIYKEVPQNSGYNSKTNEKYFKLSFIQYFY